VNMQELALHILDIVQNSIAANANLIRIEIAEDIKNDFLTITIGDNGKGMTAEETRRVTDPYFTSRTTRKVGMGLPLLKHCAQQASGNLVVSSESGNGTEVIAVFRHSHIDRPPLGDIAGVVKLLIGANPEKDFVYRHKREDREYILDSREVKEVLEGVPVNNPEVMTYIGEMVKENLKEINVI
jgi:nitrogen-specific signal transduction histidine kinase